MCKAAKKVVIILDPFGVPWSNVAAVRNCIPDVPWMLGEAGKVAGPGLIAEDLGRSLKTVIAGLVDKTQAK